MLEWSRGGGYSAEQRMLTHPYQSTLFPRVTRPQKLPRTQFCSPHNLTPGPLCFDDSYTELTTFVYEFRMTFGRSRGVYFSVYLGVVFNDSFPRGVSGRLAAWVLAGWVHGWLGRWLAWLAGWVADWLGGRPDGLLGGWTICWVASWLV